MAEVQADQRLGLEAGNVPDAVYALAEQEYRGALDVERPIPVHLGWCELIACLRGDVSHDGIMRAAFELQRIMAAPRE